MFGVIWQKAQEEHNKKMEVEMHSLFKFSQGVAHLWDVHEIGLARQERALQEKLEECRRDHDYANQVSAVMVITMDENGVTVCSYGGHCSEIETLCTCNALNNPLCLICALFCRFLVS